MAIASAFRRVYDFLANMGLILRDDPPKAIDLANREWGESRNNIVLSIREIGRDDPGQPPTVSIVLKNSGSTTEELAVPGWLFFYRFEVISVDGAPVALSPYGNEVLKPERRTENIRVKLGPGDATETSLPLGTFYAMQPGREYKVRVFCEFSDGGSLASNEILIRL